MSGRKHRSWHSPTVVDDDTVAGSGAAPAVNRWQLVGVALVLPLVLLLVGWRRRLETRVSAQREQLPPIRDTLDGPRETAVASPAISEPRHGRLQQQRMISQFNGGDYEQAAAVLRGWVGR